MELTVDELAGIVDLFGGLTRTEIHSAVADLAARAGTDYNEEVTADAIAGALNEFALVELEQDDETLLVVGPSALPTLPEYGDDLPHILAIEPRSIDHAQLAHTTEAKLRAEAAQAVNNEDVVQAKQLLDASYELDAWLDVDTSSIRERLDVVGN